MSSARASSSTSLALLQRREQVAKLRQTDPELAMRQAAGYGLKDLYMGIYNDARSGRLQLNLNSRSLRDGYTPQMWAAVNGHAKLAQHIVRLPGIIKDGIAECPKIGAKLKAALLVDLPLISTDYDNVHGTSLLAYPHLCRDLQSRVNVRRILIVGPGLLENEYSPQVVETHGCVPSAKIDVVDKDAGLVQQLRQTQMRDLRENYRNLFAQNDLGESYRALVATMTQALEPLELEVFQADAIVWQPKVKHYDVIIATRVMAIALKQITDDETLDELGRTFAKGAVLLRYLNALSVGGVIYLDVNAAQYTEAMLDVGIERVGFTRRDLAPPMTYLRHGDHVMGECEPLVAFERVAEAPLFAAVQKATMDHCALRPSRKV